MGLWFTSKAGIAEHEGGKLLQENPAWLAWLMTHKAGVGDAFIIGSALLMACGDPRCMRLGPPLLIVGGILKGAGVIPSDADAKARALSGTIITALPAIEAIAAQVHEIIKPQIDLQLAVHKDETLKEAFHVATNVVNGVSGASS